MIQSDLEREQSYVPVAAQLGSVVTVHASGHYTRHNSNASACGHSDRNDHATFAGYSWLWQRSYRKGCAETSSLSGYYLVVVNEDLRLTCAVFQVYASCSETLTIYRQSDRRFLPLFYSHAPRYLAFSFVVIATFVESSHFALEIWANCFLPW